MNDERLFIILNANADEFERALQEDFKPALRNAINGVLSEFMERLGTFITAQERTAGEIIRAADEEALARRIYRYSDDIEKARSDARMALVQFSIPRAENAATDEAAK